MTQPPPPICDYCGKWTDGIHVSFHAEHAPREARGYWRRLS
jgi:hypothetical protein